jgi:LuxR family maltose regulon positive regulatory protein
MAHIGLGSVLYEWNDLEEAENLLQLGIVPGAQTGDLSLGPGQTFLIDGYLTLAKVQRARGDLRGAAASLEKAALSASEGDPAELGRVASAQARLALIRGDLAAASRWAHAAGLSADDKLDHWRESEYLTLARLLLAQAQTEKALALLERLRQGAEDGQRMSTVIQALLLQALVFQARNEHRSALIALEQSLALAEPQGYTRLILDEGPAVAELLPEVGFRRAAIDPGYLANLQAALDSPGIDDARGLVEPLTGRELEVLRHIAAGLSNRQIADELVITVATVKKHAGNIYGKLGVQSRTQAVARGMELGLLATKQL